MRQAAIALFVLAGCAEPTQKQLQDPPPLPADIAMRLGGSYSSIEFAFRAYKAAWMGESRNSDLVVGVIAHPDRRHLWTVVGLSGQRGDGPLTITLITGNEGVFEPEVVRRHLSNCPGVEFPFQPGWTNPLNANDSKKTRAEKTTVIPNPEYVLLTRNGEYHFQQTQDANAATQIDAFLVALDSCAAN